MSRQKKPFIRWVGEALLIFLSVLGAFYFDNLREERNKKKQYVQHLTDFKSDLMSNQGKFNFELADSYDPNTSQGYLKHIINELVAFDSLLNLPPSQTEAQLIDLINENAIRGLGQWIYPSPQYDKLSTQFYSFIRNDSLRMNLEMHYRNNISRQSYKDAINGHVSNFEFIEDQLNLLDGTDRRNRTILYGNESRNKIRRIKNTYEELKRFTELTKRNDSLLLIHVENELAAWGK